MAELVLNLKWCATEQSSCLLHADAITSLKIASNLNGTVNHLLAYSYNKLQYYYCPYILHNSIQFRETVFIDICVDVYFIVIMII